MAELYEVYKCEGCGNITMVIHDGAGNLACCGSDMILMTENTVDAAKEKHVPVIKKTDDGYLVKVGEVAHPMDEKHYIEWIELTCGQARYFKQLSPGDTPEAEFCACKTCSGPVVARAYCNLHGLWKA
ncbi:desulfoferrodoxin [Maridesulfovibrio hydrothermalis]|uniref:Desulfoferrodoxin n=1 Tax=Maridesulfovibrio hydrothermalis AM13 = DSM 14728 TaxID=1121451 RepID=L0RBL1_9BACT|nr:desulfoferrodoxin [Maridesulfovibrio hydrothermalis]CCO22926.1 Desulfoferrodoxin [Maridesulfovibrio hydrothermalis AM13 = DSM 14728]